MPPNLTNFHMQLMVEGGSGGGGGGGGGVRCLKIYGQSVQLNMNNMLQKYKIMQRT